MAWVWRAEDTVLHRPVAVKLLRDEFASDEQFVRRFQQEAQAAASLVHPNVVHVYDVGEENGQHYIVMELVEGETLKERIQRQGPLPTGRALQIAAAIARALTAAHRKGIVHRDIKPQNILLTREGRVKVADFGIARAASGTTIVHTNTIIGSAHYFAPEQARGGFTDTKSDLYSVGAVMYEMLTGQPPFEGATPVAVALQHIQEPPVSPRKRRPELPRSVESIVLRLLEKDPAKRYQSAEGLLQDLHRALDEIGEPHGDETEGEDETPSPVASREPRALRQQRRPGRARIWPWAVLALVFFVLVWGGMRAFSAWIYVPQVKVAKVEGLPVSRAREILKKSGLNAVVAGQEFTRAKRGTVVTQDPGAGEVVKQGRLVSLWISRGPQVVSVPGVVGMSEGDAKINLQSSNFKVKVQQVPSQQPQGTVVNQNPAQSARRPEYSTVTISVSQGPGPTQAAVPDLTGLSLNQAQTELKALNVPVSKVDYAYSTTSSQTVLQQSVAPGTQVTSGMTIVLTVSQGPPPTGGTGPQNGPQQVTVSYTGPGTVQCVLWLVDVTGTQMILNQQLESGTPVQLNVAWQGSGRLEEYINNQLTYSQPLPVQGPIVTK